MDVEAAVKKAEAMAAEYERTCTGCAQSVVAGLMDALDLKNDDVFRAASGLADGIGLTGDGSCGALTGAALVIGLIFGRERKDHKDMMKPMKSYLMCRGLHRDFIAQYGSCRCHDIQQKLMGRTFNLLDPKDFATAAKCGMMEHCSRVVGRAAAMAAGLVLAQKRASGPSIKQGSDPSKSPAMEYRYATESDLDLLAEWNHQLIRDEGHRNPMTVPELRERMRGWLGGEYQAVIFGPGAQPVAYALYTENAAGVFLRQLFVRRDRRRQGIGRAAVYVLRSLWPGHKRLTVEVLTANARAIAFWRSMGCQDYCLTLEIMPEQEGH